jgi:predicted nucleic-acid-binding Zn-ribbon protein
MEENALGMEKNELQIRQPQHAIGLGGLFKGESNKSDVASASCIECGYTTLYATDPKNLIPDEE